MKKTVLALWIFLSHYVVMGQLNFYFLPELQGNSIDGIGIFKVQNLTNDVLTGRIVISIRETASKMDVVKIQTPPTTLKPGMYEFPRSVFTGSAFNFAGNKLAAIVNQTRAFPPGEYEYCFRFVPSDKVSEQEYENCFDGSIQPVVPISLIYPDDREKLCNKRPLLSWQPPMPYTAAMQFRLILVGKNEGEKSFESLLTKAPLVLIDKITTTSINYPANSPDLQEGKTYAWQVIAYQQGIVISKSEVWEFTVQCKEPAIQTENDSYRELKSMVNGNYYIANGIIKFSYNNNYNLKKLQYTILDVENGRQPIKHVPGIDIRPGLNKIDIELGELDMKVGGHYILKVMPFNEPEVEVRFIYHEESSVN